MLTKCHECGEEKERLGQHYALGSCNYPDLTDRQEEILTGLVAGDGTVANNQGERRKKHNPYVQAEMTNPLFLEWLDEQFPLHGLGVSLKATAEEQAEKGSWGEDENYSAMHSWRTMSTPKLDRYADWYNTGEKRLPEDMQLTPMTLKVWYVCDGNKNPGWYGEGFTNEYMHLYSTKENKERLKQMFTELVSGDIDTTNSGLRFNHEQSMQLWEWMGEPLPGFEYKWPDE